MKNLLYGVAMVTLFTSLAIMQGTIATEFSSAVTKYGTCIVLLSASAICIYKIYK